MPECRVPHVIQSNKTIHVTLQSDSNTTVVDHKGTPRGPGNLATTRKEAALGNGQNRITEYLLDNSNKEISWFSLVICYCGIAISNKSLLVVSRRYSVILFCPFPNAASFVVCYCGIAIGIFYF